MNLKPTDKTSNICMTLPGLATPIDRALNLRSSDESTDRAPVLEFRRLAGRIFGHGRGLGRVQHVGDAQLIQFARTQRRSPVKFNYFICGMRNRPENLQMPFKIPCK